MIALSETGREHYDALVVLGHSFSRQMSGSPDLSLPARMTGRATDVLFKTGITDVVIFSGGYTAGRGENLQTEAATLYAYANRRNPIPSDRVVLEERSYDTFSNAREVTEILKQKGFNKVALLTRADHLPRAQLLFEFQGVHTVGYACEQVLADNHENPDRYTRRVEKLFFPGHHIITKIKESILTLMFRIDPNISLQRFVVRRLRHTS